MDLNDASQGQVAYKSIHGLRVVLIQGQEERLVKISCTNGYVNEFRPMSLLLKYWAYPSTTRLEIVRFPETATRPVSP